MPITYSTTTKSARMTAVRDQMDAGGAAGKLEIGTAGMAQILATVTLGYPGASTGTVTNGVLSLAGFPKEVNASVTGTAAAARIRTSANADVITGLTVGTSGTDVIIDNTSLASGQIVRVLATPTFTHA